MTKLDFSKLTISDLSGKTMPKPATNQGIGNGLYIYAKTFQLADIARAIYESKSIEVSDEDIKDFKVLISSPSMKMLPLAMRELGRFIDEAQKKQADKNTKKEVTKKK